MNHWWLRKTTQFYSSSQRRRSWLPVVVAVVTAALAFSITPIRRVRPLDAVIAAIAAANAEGVADNTLSSENPLTITVTLTSGNGSPIANEAVQLDTSL